MKQYVHPNFDKSWTDPSVGILGIVRPGTWGPKLRDLIISPLTGYEEELSCWRGIFLAIKLVSGLEVESMNKEIMF